MLQRWLFLWLSYLLAHKEKKKVLTNSWLSSKRLLSLLSTLDIHQADTRTSRGLEVEGTEREFAGQTRQTGQQEMYLESGRSHEWQKDKRQEKEKRKRLQPFFGRRDSFPASEVNPSSEGCFRNHHLGHLSLTPFRDRVILLTHEWLTKKVSGNFQTQELFPDRARGAICRSRIKRRDWSHPYSSHVASSFSSCSSFDSCFSLFHVRQQLSCLCFCSAVCLFHSCPRLVPLLVFCVLSVWHSHDSLFCDLSSDPWCGSSCPCLVICYLDRHVLFFFFQNRRKNFSSRRRRSRVERETKRGKRASRRVRQLYFFSDRRSSLCVFTSILDVCVSRVNDDCLTLHSYSYSSSCSWYWWSMHLETSCFKLSPHQGLNYRMAELLIKVLFTFSWGKSDKRSKRRGNHSCLSSSPEKHPFPSCFDFLLHSCVCEMFDSRSSSRLPSHPVLGVCSCSCSCSCSFILFSSSLRPLLLTHLQPACLLSPLILSSLSWSNILFLHSSRETSRVWRERERWLDS